MLRTLAALAENSRLNSQLRCADSQLSVSLVPGDLMPISDLQKYQACMWHIYMQTKHSHI